MDSCEKTGGSDKSVKHERVEKSERLEKLERVEKVEVPKSKQELIKYLEDELQQQKSLYQEQVSSLKQVSEQLNEKEAGLEAMVVLFKYLSEDVSVSEPCCRVVLFGDAVCVGDVWML